MLGAVLEVKMTLYMFRLLLVNIGFELEFQSRSRKVILYATSNKP